MSSGSFGEDLGLDDDAVRARMRLLGLTAPGRARLAGVTAAVEAHAEAYVTDLYARFATVAELAALLRNDEVVVRLRSAQYGYLRTLFGAPIDDAYVESRLVIGAAHHRVGLSPQWYLAAYSPLFGRHLPLIFAAAADEADAVETVASLISTVFFDASLVLDAYEMSVTNQITLEAADAAEAGRSVSAANVEDDSAADAMPRPALARVRLTSEDADARRRFIGLDGETVAAVHRLAPLLDAETTPMLEGFYELVRSSPALAELVPDDVVPRLMAQVASYWRELATAEFDRPYAASRMRVGVIHERIGLLPQHYLAGLSHQLCTLVRAMPGRVADVAASIEVLLRAVLFDVTYVIDAYIDARADAVLRTQRYADRLVAHLADGVAVIDDSDRIQSANARFVELIGISAGLLLRIPVTAVLPMDGLPALIASARASASGRATMATRDGQRVLRITAIRLDLDGGAEPAQLAVVVDDVSELLQSTALVREEVTSLDRVLDGVAAVAWELDASSLVTLAISRPVLELIGLRDVAFLGRTQWVEQIDDADRDRFLAACAALGCGDRAHLEHRMRRADGVSIWVRTELFGSADRAGAPTIAGTTVDINDAFLAHERHIEAIGHLAGGIAHELNNALTVVDGSLDLLSPALRQLDDHDRIAAAKAAIGGAVELTNQLLAFAGRQVLDPALLAPNDVVDAMRPALQHAVQGSAVRVTLQLDAELGDAVLDRAQLTSALWALITNAREAITGAGEIVIASRALGVDDLAATDPAHGVEYVELSVSDDGRGMELDELRRCVDPFFTTKPFGAGNGLGLSAVQGFAIQSGGQLIVESKPGVGTTARLRLPRYRPPEAQPGAPRSAGRPFTVLVVEDHPLVRQVTTELVRELGYAVIEAETADEAFALANRASPDLLLTDVVLGPGLDGVTLAQALRARDPKLAVIITSGYPERRLDLSRLGADVDFLPKPINADKLDKILRRLRPGS